MLNLTTPIHNITFCTPKFTPYYIYFVYIYPAYRYALSNIKAAFTQYFSYETASQLSFIQSLGEELTMPAITICNMNKYR